VLALAGCGSSGSDSGTTTTESPAPPQRRLTVLISTDGHRFEPPYTKLGFPGTYSVTFANNDKIPHALVLDGPGGKTELGPVKPGKSVTEDVDLTEGGDYTIYCPVDDHRSKGEQGVISRSA
jgi:plastocyanin